MSRMLVIDEVKMRHKFTSLSMIEFFEWLGRLADCAHIPVDEVRAKYILQYLRTVPHQVCSPTGPPVNRSREYHGL